MFNERDVLRVCEGWGVCVWGGVGGVIWASEAY